MDPADGETHDIMKIIGDADNALIGNGHNL